MQVFLQEISDTGLGEQTTMKPCDVRAFDVNEKILSKLRKESKGFYDDALTFQYELVSDKLQAQYFLTKFHANKKWDMSLFCILDYRLSSFILH